MSEPKSLEELRSVVDVAREMVPQLAGEVLIRDDSHTVWIVADSGLDEEEGEELRDGARGILARLIERERKAAFEAGRRSAQHEEPAVGEVWQDSEDGERVRIDSMDARGFSHCFIVRPRLNGFGVGEVAVRRAPRWTRVTSED